MATELGRRHYVGRELSKLVLYLVSRAILEQDFVADWSPDLRVLLARLLLLIHHHY